jgi:hypothetical protein
MDLTGTISPRIHRHHVGQVGNLRLIVNRPGQSKPTTSTCRRHNLVKLL